MSSPRRWQCRKRLAGSQAAVDGVRSFASMSVTGQTKSVRQVLVPCPHFTRPRVILGLPSHVRERAIYLTMVVVTGRGQIQFWGSFA
jgi:hypothetical protein